MSKDNKGMANQPDRGNPLTPVIFLFQANPYPLVGKVLLLEELFDAIDDFQVSHGIFPRWEPVRVGLRKSPKDFSQYRRVTFLTPVRRETWSMVSLRSGRSFSMVVSLLDTWWTSLSKISVTAIFIELLRESLQFFFTFF